jgi:membrane-anchored protein YejM (alkaline phosphatase superfamily)
MGIPNQSALLVTLDSCRYDTFAEAHLPNIKSLGPLHLAMAPANFTYASHAAMFVGFTPGVATLRQPWVNPKFSKIFRLAGPASPSQKPDRFSLEGRSIIEGFRRNGYFTLGCGAVRWFDPKTETGGLLSQDFEAFHYAGDNHSLPRQVGWLLEQMSTMPGRSIFAFLNVGETHVPYYHEGAAWSPSLNPCVPFSDSNDADECRRRQRACVEFVDNEIQPLLEEFREASIVICADHGDCWGEDGLWGHGIYHPKVLEVPLIFRLAA